MPEQHAPTGPVLVNICPPSPLSTSAGKALEEEVSGVPSPGTELYKFQSMSVVSYELRFTNSHALIVGRGEGPVAQVRDVSHREVA